MIFNKLDLVDIPALPKAKLCRSAPNATTGSDGYRSKSGANLIVPGTSLSGITTDISGATRNPSKPDIGVWEVTPLAAATGGIAPDGAGNQTAFYFALRVAG